MKITADKLSIQSDIESISLIEKMVDDLSFAHEIDPYYRDWETIQ